MGSCRAGASKSSSELSHGDGGDDDDIGGNNDDADQIRVSKMETLHPPGSLMDQRHLHKKDVDCGG